MALRIEKENGILNSHHVMMLPSLGHGHLIPFMQLAKKLAARGFTVTFVVTFHHKSSLQKKVEAARETGLDIHLVEMEVPRDDLAIGKLNSNSTVQKQQLPPLLAANERLEGPFERFVQRFMDGETGGDPLSCLIADFLFGWASAVARKFKIPLVCFNTCGMYSCSISQIIMCDVLPLYLPRTLSGRYIVPGLPKEVRLTSLQIPPDLTNLTTESAIYQLCNRVREDNKQSWRIIANTFYDLEPDLVEHFQKINGTLRSIGPLLPPEAFEDRPSRITSVIEMGVHTESDECLDWLDAQAEDSVLYISFGSENSISSVQTEELAMGLEASGVKFVWVLRTPSDAGLKAVSSALDFLPEGYTGRMVERNQGFIVLGWAPQLSILAHPATGGFLSHCGWNAVLETITTGVPMIAWPLFSDQHINSKFLVDEIQIALEAPKRAEQNWLVPRNDVERIVQLLMVKEKSRGLRKRVKELKSAARAAVAEGGSSHDNFDLFVSELISLRTCSENNYSSVNTPVNASIM